MKYVTSKIKIRKRNLLYSTSGASTRLSHTALLLRRIKGQRKPFEPAPEGDLPDFVAAHDARVLEVVVHFVPDRRRGRISVRAQRLLRRSNLFRRQAEVLLHGLDYSLSTRVDLDGFNTILL